MKDDGIIVPQTSSNFDVYLNGVSLRDEGIAFVMTKSYGLEKIVRCELFFLDMDCFSITKDLYPSQFNEVSLVVVDSLAIRLNRIFLNKLIIHIYDPQPRIVIRLSFIFDESQRDRASIIKHFKDRSDYFWGLYTYMIDRGYETPCVDEVNDFVVFLNEKNDRSFYNLATEYIRQITEYDQTWQPEENGQFA
ncbi:hypothetical protein GCM10008939_23200 [Deinococcus aquiradiocola]|uniref:Uncharacterized protein n=1 Tax=Deinococcus aquiradiocola TaxID=393059 RepID=A0A917PHH8_9DEIO|nr:hypothetical protein GCM10008939_23200 [Deinococcus aquiradiocola]